MRLRAWNTAARIGLFTATWFGYSITASAMRHECSAAAFQIVAKQIPSLRFQEVVEHLAAADASVSSPAGPSAPPITIADHCEVTGSIDERIGTDGQSYAIRFHLRLPSTWNRRLLMEGGGGTDGVVGDALGISVSQKPQALNEGYAVVSDDGGHDNLTNAAPERGGLVAFGLDPEARANYGGAAVPRVMEVAQAILRSYYGKAPSLRLFEGCSKGGQEGVAAAQRFPTLFDGIVAGAPGLALPKTALAEAFYIQVFSAVARAKGEPITPQTLANTFSDGDLQNVSNAILRACDAADGAADGIISDFRGCTTELVLPRLKELQCQSQKTPDCLAHAQIEALERLNQGLRNARGETIYPGLPWDAGWSAPGWRTWLIGTTDGKVPSIALTMGAPALATIFSTPPVVLSNRVPTLQYLLKFDFDRDGQKIYATTTQFPRSAWQNIGEASTNLDDFRARGGKLLLFHGVSDAAFSITSTIQWYEAAKARARGDTSFLRLFAVPGMTHCGGGPATTEFDAFSLLVKWVETGKAPNSMPARAGGNTPWPGRTRPLCAFPKVARKKPDALDLNIANSFVCQ